MKKTISAFIAAVCLAAGTVSLAACGNGNQTHSHVWSQNYTQEGDRHYQACNGCDEKNYASHSYNADGICVCGKQKEEQGEVKPPVTPAELKEISTYFSGIKVNENKASITDNGTNKTFNEILDRQFTVLAEDILYRLYVTYGERTYGTGGGFGDITLSDGNYTYNGNSAKVAKSKILTDTENHTIIEHKFGPNGELSHIDCISCYQYNLDGEQTRLTSGLYIMISEAIMGNHHNWDNEIWWLNNTNADNYKWLYGETDDIWIYNDSNGWLENNYTNSKWNTDYRTAFKYELAKIVYGDGNTNLTYDQLLAKINTTGFAAETEQKIIDTIYKKVIGENLVAEDLRIYNLFTDDDKSNIKMWTDESEIEKHYFKGYNITVPAIVKQALANTFENTSVNLYPVVSRQSVNVSNNFNSVAVTENTQSLVLMPKANAPVTKLAVELSGSAGQSVTLNFNIVANGAINTVSKTVTLTAATQTVEIDLTAAGVNTLGAYNGNTNSYTDTALFDNADGADANGDNYISLDLTDNAVEFSIKFTGIYGK